MGYLVKGTSLVGTITLHRVSSVGAIKKAGELIADGYREVQITAPDGGRFGHENFNKLASASDRRLLCPRARFILRSRYSRRRFGGRSGGLRHASGR